jgi:hypothetical protein
MTDRAEVVARALAGPTPARADAHRSRPPALPIQRQSTGPNFVKASELITRELPKLKWAIPGIQPAGLTLLVGRPKLGKSSLVGDLGIASAAGGRALGRVQVEAADTHLNLLEDTERRVKSRLVMQLEGAPCPDHLTISTTWPRLDQGGLEWTEAWGKKHPGGRIWFDTFAKIRPASSRNGTLYQDDYAALAGLQTIAGRYELAIGVVHHTRKMGSDDPLETISGTQGLAGAADTILILRRERAHRDATLFVTGRDVEEAEIALRFDPGRCRWSLLGEELSEERLAVVKVLRHAARPLAIKEIALALGRSDAAVRLLCWRMGNAGQILIEGKGRYSCNTRTLETPETKETVETGETIETVSSGSVSAYPLFQGLGDPDEQAYLEAITGRADVEAAELEEEMA